MEFVTGIKEKETINIADIISGERYGSTVKLNGAVHTIRDMSEFAFVVLRKSEGLVQCVFEDGRLADFNIKSLREESTVEVEGIVHKEDRAPNGFEILLTKIIVLSEPAKETTMPIPISKWKLNTSLETKLALRPVSLRNIRERAIFKIQEGLVRGFRDFLFAQNFTEVRTPKIVAGNAEGGANVFKLEYFGKKAFLAQSPQFYKQTMVGIYDRVFEVAPVFRAEKHNTTRHLNEYTSMDFEMGYIESFEEIMEMEQAMLLYTFELLKREYEKELKILNIELPDITKIPAVRFDEAKRLVSEKYNRKIKNPYDLEPEEEVLIGKYFEEEYGSDFVFVTHYPSKKRPFYAMDDPKDPKYTLSFDLLFKGMEITTGGQRIHQYDEQVDKMVVRGMDPEDFTNYLMIHKHGMPPHGGLGIGLERLTMRLLNESNVRETTLFPRDVSKLEP
ncbi:nondiscriminating aspartyl-tRNA synthetase [Mobilisporobacter senegalensis]|uniref:Aspartate--tRNA(Asp/Asn) ligase n=1 Tax=Mobilisporobacter senegalensis TaxID=1329262 RepID=A0A3N1XL56_9FIRM|nr:aspartate--tRNA(Asn) ligase [Mobilisporobacter senegalensis]ROR27445.1 nondiscriminating aspartyl-tRNA synthetase [Mobilisporobacter senegalensis]